LTSASSTLNLTDVSGYKISENFAQRMKSTILAVERMPLSATAGKIPVRFEDKPVVGNGGGGTTIRLGQFTGSWYNEPGLSGADNVKLVKLYIQEADAGGANDWVPELDSDGEEVIAVTLNLFSYIPTRSGNDSYMWCAVLPISDAEGEYWTGSYEWDGAQDVPIMKPYTKLWLLLAAEC